MRISSDSNSDPCPVPDDVLGALYRSNKEGLPELIATVSMAIHETAAKMMPYTAARPSLTWIEIRATRTIPAEK